MFIFLNLHTVFDVTAQIHIPDNSVQDFLLATSSPTLVIIFFLTIAILKGVSWYLSVD